MSDYKKASGGNNRGWTAKYNEMMSKYEYIKELYKEGLIDINRIRGFEDCLRVYHPDLGRYKGGEGDD